jgi:hypothetical protein
MEVEPPAATATTATASGESSPPGTESSDQPQPIKQEPADPDQPVSTADPDVAMQEADTGVTPKSEPEAVSEAETKPETDIKAETKPETDVEVEAKPEDPEATASDAGLDKSLDGNAISDAAPSFVAPTKLAGASIRINLTSQVSNYMYSYSFRVQVPMQNLQL